MISLDEGITSKQLFDQLVQRIISSGLQEDLVKIYVITCGNIKHLKTNFEAYDKVTHVYHCDSILEFEFPTLKKMYDDSHICSEDHKVLYLHLKGASKPSDKDSVVWGNTMFSIVVDKYQLCTVYLDQQNIKTVGTCYSNSYIVKNNIGRHYSGNFWWSKFSHIKTLPNPIWHELKNDYSVLIEGRINKNWLGPQHASYRYLAEFWIGLHDLNPNSDTHGMISI